MTLSGHHSMMAGGVALPYDHEVEFLESTGTQYINTGVKGNQTTSAVLRAAFLESGNDKPLFAADNGTTFTDAFSLSTWVGIRFVRGRVNATPIPFSADVVYDITCGPSGIDVGGTSYSIASTPDFETTGTIPLCAWNRNGSIIIKTKCRIYRAQFYQGETLVFDGIPVRKDGVGEMYDRVSGAFAPRYGTFVIGPDVSAPVGGV